ncbi:hypothetical protein IMZ48_09490, partial [Candidatus Bathyarchaeota archaeon]|nr:hypothetical protein [Candidatus Bathyarchaeota archaeon]
MHVWETSHEPLLLAHLHGFLVQKGYFKPLDTYRMLHHTFSAAFFRLGLTRESDFHESLVWRVKKMKSELKSSRQSKKKAVRTSNDVHDLLSLEHNLVTKEKSLLGVCKAADYDATRISPDEVHPASELGKVHLSRTKITIDAAGKRQAEQTPIVAKAGGLSDEALLWIAKNGSIIDFVLNNPRLQISDAAVNFLTADGTSYIPAEDRDKWTKGPRRGGIGDLGPTFILKMFRDDVSGDVSGDQPMSGTSYLLLTCYCMRVFDRIEERLAAGRNATYLRAYEAERRREGGEKRTSLVLHALQGGDEECLRIMAAVMEEQDVDPAAFVFWFGAGGRPKDEEVER